MNAIRVEHRLGRDGGRQRLQELSARHGIAVESTDDGYSGTLVKSIPFVGAVRAQFRALDDALELSILEAPSFLSEETIQRMVTDELGRALSR